MARNTTKTLSKAYVSHWVCFWHSPAIFLHSYIAIFRKRSSDAVKRGETRENEGERGKSAPFSLYSFMLAMGMDSTCLELPNAASTSQFGGRSDDRRPYSDRNTASSSHHLLSTPTPHHPTPPTSSRNVLRANRPDQQALAM